MQFAINTPNFGSFSDVRLMAELAHEAEDAGTTWWQESFAGSDLEELEAVRTRIRQGPPRLDLKEKTSSFESGEML